MKQFVITINPQDGSVTYETKGYQGKACRLETAAYEKALGVTVKTTATAEANRVPVGGKVNVGR